MSNRVIVLSDRPAAIEADVAVDLPFPRHRGDPRLADPRLADPRLADPRLADPRLADLRRRILGLLGLDADW